MTETRPASPTVVDAAVADVRDALSRLADPDILHVNHRHGDDHAVNLTKLRAVAKETGTGRTAAVKHEIGTALWQTGDSACRLAATLLLRPKAMETDELDEMLRDARTPKVHNWLLNYVVMKSGRADELRPRWFDDPDPTVASAGWALTTQRLVKRGDEVSSTEIRGLLDTIESTMADSGERLQWAQNECLAQIGIHYPGFRDRAVSVGERLGVLKDYPTPKNCTSPYAPVWIAEMVSRQSGQ
ncbi:DNA alkylation repair protein [Corynebacterium sp.]|uniref:DNA alkylation repair protein n=1 Tax=Corynebacterium sp. TaxID=1720 RepID=UPI0028AFEE7F|nr:DNA alkylation repair protein [Corynebacterium sp.]